MQSCEIRTGSCGVVQVDLGSFIFPTLRLCGNCDQPATIEQLQQNTGRCNDQQGIYFIFEILIQMCCFDVCWQIQSIDSCEQKHTTTMVYGSYLASLTDTVASLYTKQKVKHSVRKKSIPNKSMQLWHLKQFDMRLILTFQKKFGDQY